MKQARKNDEPRHRQAPTWTGFEEWEHHPLTVEGEIEGIGRLARGASQASGRRRRVGKTLVMLPLIGGLLAMIIVAAVGTYREVTNDEPEPVVLERTVQSPRLDSAGVVQDAAELCVGNVDAVRVVIRGPDGEVASDIVHPCNALRVRLGSDR